MYGSFTTTVKWKSLAFSALCTYALGGKVYDSTYSSLMSTSTGPSNYSADILNSWRETPAGMTATSADRIWYGGTPQINSSKNKDNNAVSSRWITNGNYFVVKNVNLSYQLPQKWVRAIDLDNVRLSFSAENLLSLSSRRGLNPQQAFSGMLDNYAVTPRVFIVGLEVKF